MPEVKVYKRTMAIMWVSKILISETHHLTSNALKNHVLEIMFSMIMLSGFMMPETVNAQLTIANRNAPNSLFQRSRNSPTPIDASDSN